MKIAVWHNLPSGGAKRALFEQVRGLLHRGHTVEVWCPSSADGSYLPLSDLVTEHVIPLEWREPVSTGRLANMMYPFRSVRSHLLAMERACELCAKEIAVREFDVLFSNACLHFRVPPIGRLLPSLPTVHYLHEPFRKHYEALPDLPWVQGGPTLASELFDPRVLHRIIRDWIRLQSVRLQAYEERRNAEGFGRLLVNSLYSRESVLRAYGLEANVCYLGIATDLFRISDEPRERFVVSVGTMTFEKGVDIAIRAIATIAKEQRPPLVWIANTANSSYCNEMQSLARTLDVDFDLRTLVSDAELVSVLNRAALMVYTPRLEPFGLAPLEANACGTPVVAVAEGGVRETIRSPANGALVHSRDPVALGRAILAVLEDSQDATQRALSARAEVLAHWTWEAAVERLEAFLISAVEIRTTAV